jgi:pyruvate dehydrogenase E1 component beta subunit
MCGLRPVAEIMFVDFIGSCLDQVMNQAAKFRYMFGGKARTPMVLRATYGAGTGSASQHSQTLHPLFTHLPGSSSRCQRPLRRQGAADPGDPGRRPGHLPGAQDALRHDGRGSGPGLRVPFGEAAIPREGGDVTIVAFGRMVHVALEAAKRLAADGIECAVIDPRTPSPLDTETILESVEETGRLVVVDESYPRCSLAADVAALAAEEAFGALKAPIIKVNPPHAPVPYAPELERAYIPSAERVEAAVRKVMGYRR